MHRHRSKLNMRDSKLAVRSSRGPKTADLISNSQKASKIFPTAVIFYTSLFPFMFICAQQPKHFVATPKSSQWSGPEALSRESSTKSVEGYSDDDSETSSPADERIDNFGDLDISEPLDLEVES
jgi:hypothetical protein